MKRTEWNRPEFVYGIDDRGNKMVMRLSAYDPTEWWDLYNERVYDDAYVARHWPNERAAALAEPDTIQPPPLSVYDRVAAILAGAADH